MKIDTERVGKAIARLRAMRGLTQEQLNQRIGMKTIQHIEQGRNTPSLETLNKIADALDMPAACIVLLGSTIDPSDRVLSSLNSLLETTLSLEAEQPQPVETDRKTAKRKRTATVTRRSNRTQQPVKSDRKTAKASGSRKASGKSEPKAAGKASKTQREKVLA